MYEFMGGKKEKKKTLQDKLLLTLWFLECTYLLQQYPACYFYPRRWKPGQLNPPTVLWFFFNLNKFNRSIYRYLSIDYLFVGPRLDTCRMLTSRVSNKGAGGGGRLFPLGVLKLSSRCRSDLLLVIPAVFSMTMIGSWCRADVAESRFRLSQNFPSLELCSAFCSCLKVHDAGQTPWKSCCCCCCYSRTNSFSDL